MTQRILPSPYSNVEIKQMEKSKIPNSNHSAHTILAA
jgi:hypothetical protein